MKNKKKVRVKSFFRKGKLVKGYQRNQEIKNKILTGLAGAGLVGAGVLVGKGKKINPDDITKQIISKLPKTDIDEKRIIDNVKEQLTKQKEEINKIVEDKLKNIEPTTINEEKIISGVRKELQKQKDEINKIVENKIKQNANLFQNATISVSSVNQSLIDLPVRQVKLPSRIESLSKKSIEKMQQEAEKLTDEELKEKIFKLSDGMNNYTDSLIDIGKIDRLNDYLKQLQNENFKSRTEESIKKELLEELNNHFKLRISNLDDLIKNKTQFNTDKEYRNRLKKLMDRKRKEIEIYQDERTKRTSKKEISTPTDKDIERFGDILEDFSLQGKLITFKKGRKKGSKDKKKRKNRLPSLRASLLVGGVLGGGIYTLNNSINKMHKISENQAKDKTIILKIPDINNGKNELYKWTDKLNEDRVKKGSSSIKPIVFDDPNLDKQLATKGKSANRLRNLNRIMKGAASDTFPGLATDLHVLKTKKISGKTKQKIMKEVSQKLRILKGMGKFNNINISIFKK